MSNEYSYITHLYVVVASCEATGCSENIARSTYLLTFFFKVSNSDVMILYGCILKRVQCNQVMTWLWFVYHIKILKLRIRQYLPNTL